jgi:predicted TIM-barrel fold metal-dependent hydrolase
MPIPFTDTHVHFHDLTEPSLEYSWLDRGGDPAETEGLGEYGAIRSERYWPQDFLAEARRHDLDKVIHVQNATGPDPVTEARWLYGFHEQLGLPHAIIGWCDLAAPHARDVIEAQMRFSFFRGVRDPRTDDYLTNPAWEAGLAVLAEHKLVCCDDPPITQAAQAAALAARNEGATFCLDHCLWPALQARGDFERWRDALRVLAAVPTTVIKISGLGMVERQWTIDSLRERVLTCIEVFGVERAFFGSNWTVDRLYASYGDVIGAYREIVSDFSDSEQRALLSDNAKRVFGLT